MRLLGSGIVKEQSYGQAVHSADDWQEVLDPVVERYFTAAVRLLFRADAAFAKPEIYEYLETRQIDYAIRLPANEVLQRKIAHLRPTEGPSPKPIVSYHDFTYQAQWIVPEGWWPHQGELFPRVGVTNLSYQVNEPAEQWIKEGKYNWRGCPATSSWPIRSGWGCSSWPILG